MNKEFTICLNCKHCKKVATSSMDPTWRYDCLASPYEAPVNPVTGQVIKPGFYFCATINLEGNCSKFVPGENQCNLSS
jgi:hypothetical protein